MSKLARLAAFGLVGALAIAAAQRAQAQVRSWQHMPTGNGHGFQVYSREAGRITDFLEHPYRYVAPGDDLRKWGIGRRDLAHDIYFGARVGGTSKWLNNCGNADCTGITSAEYEAQSHIVHARASFGGVDFDLYYFAPFGYGGNGMLMLARATNTGGSAVDVSLYAKPNLKLGSGRVDPADSNEEIEWKPGATPPHALETGPGGGHALYLPLGEVAQASAGSDSDLYNAVLGGGDIGSTASSTGTARVVVFRHDASLAPGAEAWFGTAVLFLNDDPADSRASLFRDSRTVPEILDLWQSFRAGRDAEALHDDALTELAAWRGDEAPAGLDAKEQKLWRQSEVILRMGQIREKPKGNEGMMLAALPIGEWHTGWVRDGAYALVALAMTGHGAEARLGVEFFVGAESGFFSDLIGAPYRVSACRYFGNGMEEGDYNQDGPNVETDGWGLILWAARAAIEYDCDLAWLGRQTWKGDTVFEALREIADDITGYSNGDLPGPDASIWEVHWNYRQVFAYTAATQIRGLFDFAHIADAYGRSDLAAEYRERAEAMRTASKSALVHAPTRSLVSHMGVAADDVHVDGSTVAFLDWGLVEPGDPISAGTLGGYSKLLTGFGGYRRLEPALSLTGSGSASEYDLSEWILLDLRIGDAFRRAGNAGQADTLLDKVTDHAAVNDFLVPELYNPDNGRYAGVVPMVGYGAGAWMMSQLEKSGTPAPPTYTGLEHCSPCEPDPCTGDHQLCVADGAGYTCVCAPGYHDEGGGTCAEDTVCDPATTCAGHGSCTGEGLECLCDEGWTGDNCTDCAAGYHSEGTACVEDTACNPNPCTEPNRALCVELDESEGGGQRCDCNSGYVLEDDACVEAGGGGGPEVDEGFDDASATLCGAGGSAGATWVVVPTLLALALVAIRGRKSHAR